MIVPGVQMTPRQPFDRRQFLVVMLVEGAAMATAVGRLVLSRGAITLKPPHELAWFLTAAGLAAFAMVHFSVRSSVLRIRERRGDEVPGARQSVLAVSVALGVGALLVAAVGPGPFALLLASERAP